MIAQPSFASPSDSSSGLAAAGWAALEHGDVEGARAALQDLYTIDPTHPALPALAAGIRRQRPKRIPWGGVLLLLIVIGGTTFAVQSWRRRVVQQTVPTTIASAASSRRETPMTSSRRETPTTVPLRETPIASPPTPATGPVATSGADRQTPDAPARAPARASVADDELIRQAISRFTQAYSSKWTRLAFRSCDIARNADTANVTCLLPVTQGSAAGTSGSTWVFACRKADDAWKIVSIQPPPETPE
jgi:hypothetical protein